jgi:secreted trypsin-like serine protease
VTNSVTNFRKPSNRAILFLLAGFMISCGRATSSNPYASKAVRNVASAGVIGGQPVAKASPFEDKVMYLALGVKMETKPDGSKNVSWTGLCTASAISARIILTAAHCVVDKQAKELYIILNNNPGQSPLNLNEWYSVQAIRSHERYIGKGDGFANDLALLRLSKDLPSTRVLRMAEAEQVQLPQPLITVGFGTTSESADPKETAQKTSGLHFVPRTVEEFDVQAKTFSIDQNDHKGFCNGDSGGPGLIFNQESQEYLILGVVSNTSMENSQRSILDPKGQYSLCIGKGNYTNVLNPDLRSWIETNRSQLNQQRTAAN